MDASERGPGWTTSASDAGMNMFRSQVMLLDGERMSDYHRDANRSDSRLQASFVTPGTSTVSHGQSVFFATCLREVSLGRGVFESWCFSILSETNKIIIMNN